MDYVREERQTEILDARVVLGIERVGILDVQTGETLVEETHLQHHADHTLCGNDKYRLRTRRHL